MLSSSMFTPLSKHTCFLGKGTREVNCLRLCTLTNTLSEDRILGRIFSFKFESNVHYSQVSSVAENFDFILFLCNGVMKTLIISYSVF